ncbi:MAG TPA: carbon-nitrogen hydrolase family protein [Candidatus Kapabacteria bacterium]|jgi:predicted amidohydrolase
MRKIRIASVSFLMEDSVDDRSSTPHSVEYNLASAAQYIERAAAAGAHVVCFPETVTTVGVQNVMPTELDTEAWTAFFREQSLKNSIAIVAPFYVVEKKHSYNQATVIDRTGNIRGFYRKIQPTGSEARWLTPGNEFPVIETGFGNIAILICMDIYFPEIVRIYAMKGAEIVFWPSTTHGPTQSGLEAQLRSRAIDNSIWIVESNYAGNPPYAPYAGHYHPGNARIVDFNGDIIAQTGRRDGLAVADIDLDERKQTSSVVLIHDPDDTRADMESLVRMDLYAKEYAEIAKTQKRFYDTIK